MYMDLYDLITDWGHFKDHRRHFKLAKSGDKQRTIPSCIKFSLSELKKNFNKVAKQQIFIKKTKGLRLLYLLTMKKWIFCKKKTTYLKILKAKDHLQASQPSHDSPFSYFLQLIHTRVFIQANFRSKHAYNINSFLKATLD